MSTSRVNFKSMFLISENYFNELKDKQKEENVTDESLEPSVPDPPVPSPPTPVTALIPEPEPEPEPEATSIPKPTPTPTPSPQATTSTSLSDDEWTPNQETVNKEDGEYKSIVDKVNSFNCSVCNEAFVSEADMLAHQTRNHPEHECKLCKREFKSKRELDNHITENHEYGRQSNSSMNRSSKRLANKRARDDEDESHAYINDKLSKRRKIKVSRRKNKRSREQSDEEVEEEEEEVKPTTAKKVKVQLQNIDDIKDIRQKERKKVNNSIGEQHKVETITYPAGTLTCPTCQKEFDSLYEYQDHQMLH